MIVLEKIRISASQGLTRNTLVIVLKNCSI